MNIWEFLTMILVFGFAVFMLAGTAYLVQVHNWSAWWFLPVFLFVGSVNVKTGKAAEIAAQCKEIK